MHRSTRSNAQLQFGEVLFNPLKRRIIKLDIWSCPFDWAVLLPFLPACNFFKKVTGMLCSPVKGDCNPVSLSDILSQFGGDSFRAMPTSSVILHCHNFLDVLLTSLQK